MTGQNPENILLSAECPVLIYADGYSALMPSIKPGVNQQMKDVFDLVLYPTKELIKRYKIEKLDEKGVYHTQIPVEYIIELNPDPSWRRYFCLVTYEGVLPPASKILNGTSQQEEIKRLREEIRVKESIIEATKEKLNMIETNFPKYMKRNFAPFIESMGPMIKEIVKSEEKT